MNVIHTDIVEIWNMRDRAKVSSSRLSTVLAAHKYQYLSSAGFKETMSHIVKDLAGPVSSIPSRCVCYIQDREDTPTK